MLKLKLQYFATWCKKLTHLKRPWCWEILKAGGEESNREISYQWYKEIKRVNPKGNQSWIFIGRTDAEAEAPTLWPLDAKNWLTETDPDTGKDWRQEKGTTEDEMVEWHHWLRGHEFEQAPRVSEGQESPACCSPWGCKKPHTTERLNWTELVVSRILLLTVPLALILLHK